jgi:hypothetical protein
MVVRTLAQYGVWQAAGEGPLARRYLSACEHAWAQHAEMVRPILAA